MARAHFVQKARKDNPAVKAGESYYWWQFRYGPKRYSATRPSRSQLTSSDFLSQMFAIEDDSIATVSAETLEDLESAVEDIVASLEELRDEAQDNLDAIPEQLQESHMLYERVEAVEEMISELEGISFDDDDDLEEKIEEIRSVSYGGC